MENIARYSCWSMGRSRSQQLRGDAFLYSHMEGIAYGVTEKGLCYTVDRADLNPEFPIGVSNEFTGCESSIEVENGMLLVYTDKG